MPVRTRAQTRAARMMPAPVITAPPTALSAEADSDVAAARSSPRAQAAECAICLEPICWPHRLACGHAFHASCLQKWGTLQEAMRRPGSCPMCRAPLHPPAWRTLVQQSGATWIAWRCFCAA